MATINIEKNIPIRQLQQGDFYLDSKGFPFYVFYDNDYFEFRVLALDTGKTYVSFSTLEKLNETIIPARIINSVNLV